MSADQPMTKTVNSLAPDGAAKPKENAFTIGMSSAVAASFQKIDRNARRALRSTRNVEKMRARGVEPARLLSLTQGARYSPPVIGREAGAKQREVSDAIRRGGI